MKNIKKCMPGAPYGSKYSSPGIIFNSHNFHKNFENDNEVYD